jgi:hypothetical protein
VSPSSSSAHQGRNLTLRIEEQRRLSGSGVSQIRCDASPALSFRNGLSPAEYIFGVHRITEGELHLVRDPLDVMRAHENGVDNVVAFLTEAVTAQQLEMLSSLMDEKRCESLTIFG